MPLQRFALLVILSTILPSCQIKSDGPITAAIVRADPSQRLAKVDATGEVMTVLKVGTDEQVAHGMLLRETFECRTLLGPLLGTDAPKYLFCSKQFGGMIRPATEYRVVLGIDAEKVTSVWARSFYVGL